MEHVEVLRRMRNKSWHWLPEHAALDAAIASLSTPQPPAEAQEVVCLECGQPTMHMGQVCYACSHPAEKPAEAQAQGGGEACPHCKGNPGLDCNSFGRPAPPSAPVGVERLIEDWESDLAEDKRDGVSEVAIRVQEIRLDQLRTLAQQPAAVDGAAVRWAVERWNDEVANRPLVNVHRRTLDITWRQVIRHFGGDDVALCGPRHDDLAGQQGGRSDD